MTQRKQTRRRFSPELKLEAIEQVVKYQQRIVDVARALEPDSSTPGKWVRQYQAEMRGVTPVGVALTSEQRRIQEVAELCRLLKITRSVYYARRQRAVDIQRLYLRAQARALHQQSRGQPEAER